MKICAIICEYNPLHSGHKYHIEKARRAACADAVLCIMSGNFVQRAEPAIFDKYTRAKAALYSGADFVFELPTIFAVANGQKFAEGAIGILNKFEDVASLCFSCEDASDKLLQRIAAVQTEESQDFKDVLRENLANGLSYPSSYCAATVYALNKADETRTDKTSDYEQILKKPNNLLAIEYLKALKRTASKIKPVFVQRKGNGYNNLNAYGDYISATAARSLFAVKDYTALSPYIPSQALISFTDEYSKYAVNDKAYEILAVNALRNNDLQNLYDCGEGIENKLKENAFNFLSLEEILQNTKSKRYTLARLKRIVVQNLLGITKSVMDDSSVAVTRLLGIREEMRPFIGSFPSVAVIKNSDLEALTGKAADIAAIDKKASNIYSLISGKKGNQYFENRIITV